MFALDERRQGEYAALSNPMPAPPLDPRLIEILACPACHSTLRAGPPLTCKNCGIEFKTLGSVPVFLNDVPDVMPQEHTSNPLGAEFEETLREGRDFVLNIGAGATAIRYPNCIELEHKIFRHTDVVGDAHHLPFRDSVFDRVFAFNVFEHLREPGAAAREILRVLKPGGRTTIHTAFLQPLHEEPHHFYNATEFGVRAWFSPFEIESCRVSGNFGPGVMLAFLSANVLDAAQAAKLSASDQALIENTTLAEWARWWRAPTEAPPPAFHLLQNLPPELQARVAAGFELIARKPDQAG